VGKLEVKSLNRNFSFTNRCKVKGNISNGIKGLVILRKGEYSCGFVEKILLVAFFDL